MPVFALNNMINVGLFTTGKLNQIEQIANEFGYINIKTALNFGFLTRKEYVAFLERSGFPLIDIRNEEIDETFVSQCDLLHLNSFLYLPIRNDGHGYLIVATADPLDEKLQGYLEVKFETKIKMVAASDLDITWKINILRGEYYVKDPSSSGIVTFTDAQLAFIFIFFLVAFVMLSLFFVNAFIFFNLFFSFFFLFAIVFKLYIAL
jgi:hypothetical protein